MNSNRRVSCVLFLASALGLLACDFGVGDDDDCDSYYVPGSWSQSGGARVVREDGTTAYAQLSSDSRKLEGSGTFLLDGYDGRGCRRLPGSGGDTANGSGDAGVADAGRADASRDAGTDARAPDSGSGSCQEYSQRWLVITWTNVPEALFDVRVCPTDDAWFASDDVDAQGRPLSCRDTKGARTRVTHRTVRGLVDTSATRLRLLAKTPDVDIDASASYLSGPPMSGCYGH